MHRMTGAQALAAQLRSEAVDTVFALPGVQIMAAFDALYDLREDVRLVHTRHEQATTYMADGYARVSGKPGVAMVVPGPGALNAAAGLGTAYASSSPVLLISGQVPSGFLGQGKGLLHEIDDQLDVFRPITKWNHRVTAAGEIPEAVHEAFRQMQTGRPRPVELEIPPDTLAAADDIELIEPEEYARQAPEANGIERAAQLLAAATRPAIIAGGGAVRSGASDVLLELAEFLQAPVMTSPQGKGAVPEDHHLCIGVNYYVSGPAHRVLPSCDVLLAVGTRLQIRDLDVNPLPKVVHIDADREEIGRNMPVEVALEADARETVALLLDRLRSSGAPRESRREEIEGYREEYRAEIDRLAADQAAIIGAVRRELAPDDVLVSGMTNVGYWSHVAYPVRRPRTYITSSYFGTLGYGFPTALGAKVAAPGRNVVALCGDGGFLYSAEELSTAVRHGINVVAVVFNNHAYGASHWDQTHQYGGRFIGTDLHNPDFVKLAESFGVKSARTQPAGLGEALREALAAESPVLLEVELPIMMPPFQVIQ